MSLVTAQYHRASALHYFVNELVFLRFDLH